MFPDEGAGMRGDIRSLRHESALREGDFYETP